ncbi:MAG: orotate phosphoribosyltransferase, partial [Fimbriimonadaceae bacterium]|nr:orotate phosphoribosyltransferase [Chitinophagales bacterium]
MLFNESVAKLFTAYLLDINAIKLNPQQPFTWASGWKSPIYCDNRLTLSFPDVRTFIKNNLALCIQQHYGNVDSIAGVATAGIPHGVLVAEALNKPFIYVRNEAKKHGLTNQIEGKLNTGDTIVVVEDLISTGMSSLQAVDALRNAGANVLGLTALFTYGFDIAQEAFEKTSCSYYTLTDYPTLI